jgi:mannose-6-phosphate isomerase-like protein (cupin superfamily)
MDMMRGEEVEAVGLYSLLGCKGPALFVLPGTHNKFVPMGENGEILGCMTSISGELLDAITHHTIIADAVGHSFVAAEEYDSDMAKAGAWECSSSGIGRAAFAGRILSTLGGKEKTKAELEAMGLRVNIAGNGWPTAKGTKKGVYTADELTDAQLQNLIKIDSTNYSDGYMSLTKVLHLKSGRYISYQIHEHRQEVWTVVDGEGIVVLDGVISNVSRGDVLTIKRGQKHAIKAVTDLQIVEVQMGSSLVEEDIERFEWEW